MWYRGVAELLAGKSSERTRGSKLKAIKLMIEELETIYFLSAPSFNR